MPFLFVSSCTGGIRQQSPAGKLPAMPAFVVNHIPDRQSDRQWTDPAWIIESLTEYAVIPGRIRMRSLHQVDCSSPSSALLRLFLALRTSGECALEPALSCMDKIDLTGACSCLLCHSAYEVACLDSTARTSHVVMSTQLSWGKLAAKQQTPCCQSSHSEVTSE